MKNRDEFHRHNVHSGTKGCVLYGSIRIKFKRTEVISAVRKQSGDHPWEAGKDRRRCGGWWGAHDVPPSGCCYTGMFTLRESFDLCAGTVLLYAFFCTYAVLPCKVYLKLCQRKHSSHIAFTEIIINNEKESFLYYRIK